MNSNISRLGWRWPQRLLEAGLALLFPPRCVGCGQEGEHWCHDCMHNVSKVMGRLCPQCGFPLHSRRLCLACRSSSIPIQVRSYAWYEGALSRALVNMKYRPNKDVSGMMGNWLATLYTREKWDADMVIPVPLAQARLLQRGFNQAALISQPFAETLGLRHADNVLFRDRDTKSQVGLDATARLRNVRGAFRAEKEDVQGQRLVLVDDLYTTGATLSSCAKVLLHEGAKAVYGLTVGRARGRV